MDAPSIRVARAADAAQICAIYAPIALYPKVGYKAGAWHDVGWWQLELAERSSAPLPVLPFSEVQWS